MGYEPVEITFGGVLDNTRANLPGKAATASSGFVLGADGRSVRSRLGYDNFTSSPAAASYRQLYTHSDTKLLARRTTTIAAINTSGAEATTTTVSSANFVHATRFGTPSASYSYIADGSTALIRYDGTSFSAGTTSATVDGSGSQAMPKGNHLTVTGSSNRLVVAGTASSGGPGGATSGGSYVWFSEPGSAETWDSNNYVQLDPGDGESIVGCCTWRDQVFVFKQTKLYVFYSETTDSAGDPIFNYRSVSIGNEAEPVAPTSSTGSSVTVAPEGVYFISANRVWATTGDVPTCVSDSGYPGTGFDPSPLQGADVGQVAGLAGVHYHLGRVYARTNTASLRVYDAGLGEWMPWAVAGLNCLTSWKAGGTEPRLMASLTTSNDIAHWSYASNVFTDDNGTAFDAIYRSLPWDLGLAGEKSVREVEVWGAGSCSVRLITDFTTAASASSLTLGTATTESAGTRQFARTAARGTYFAVEISGTSYWRIDRIILHLRDAKNVGAKSS